jgi:imidazolonepropionase-like amidohydrolase
MKRVLIFAFLAGLLSSCAAHNLGAQDLVVTNARIVVGNGTVISSGSIVVQAGKIAFVAPGPANPRGMQTNTMDFAQFLIPQGANIKGTVQTIDAKGMTVMPGFIDAHRHIMNGNPEKWLKEDASVRMQEFLDAGYTTLLSGGGPMPGILELQKKVDSGEIKGPRIIASGVVDLNNSTTDQARAEVRRLAGLGIKFIGEEGIDPVPTDKQLENLRAVVDESKKVNVWVMVHAVSGPAMLAAVEAGAPKLVHTPHFGWLSDDDARKVAAAGVKDLSTIAFGTPVFGVFADDNKPRFRDGQKWPDAILAGEGRGREAGYKAVNARTLFDNGVIYGYGTDTGYLPKAGLAQELKALNLMFSMQDVIRIMGPNTASFIEMSDQLGTLEAGKLADMVILGGSPLDGYWEFLDAKVVIKGGVVMLDRR